MPHLLYWPTKLDRLLQPFGVNPQNYPKDLNGHEGLDFGAPEGSEIYACADGEVTAVRLEHDLWVQSVESGKTNWSYAYGNQVRITHDHGAEGKYETVYAHLLEARVHVGERVRAGQIIGLAGNTGNSHGSHLHLTLKKEGATKAGETTRPRDIIDPTPFLQPFGVRPTAAEPTDTATEGGEAATVPAPVPVDVDALRYVADLTIPDGSAVPAGQQFTKTWRITNSGGTAWGADYTLVHIAGDSLGGKTSFPLTMAQPGKTVDVSIDLRAPASPSNRVVSRWRAHNGKGVAFGGELFLLIRVVEADESPAIMVVAEDGLRYIRDVNFPGNASVLGGQALRKLWRVQNAGRSTWGAGYTLASVTNDPRRALKSVALPAAKPGEEINVEIMITTPPNPGTYQSRWQARNEQGQPFGDVLSLVITIPELTEPA